LTKYQIGQLLVIQYLSMFIIFTY